MLKKIKNWENIIGGQIFLTLLITLLTIAAAEGATGTVDVNTVYQQLEGFGGAAVYECPSLTTHTLKDEIYNLLFKELGIDILRIRNTYGYSDGGANLNATAAIIAEARDPNHTPSLKVELVPWSPPGYLKSNGTENSGGTLAKSGGVYVYDAYADWWYDSLVAWEANGVVPDFISLQNEPDCFTDYDSCRFNPTEADANAGYDQAYEHVFDELYSQMGLDIPQMWAPCTMGFGNSIPYITALIDRGQIDNVAGFSHHLYTDGSYDSPDGMISGMQSYYDDYGYKPLHMTEYVKLYTTPNFDMAWKFAWHIYNCLYYEGVTSYFNWTLFRAYGGTSGGGIVTLDTQSHYIIRPQYWYLKAYAHFTDKDWYVLDTSISGTDNLRMSAFKDPNNQQLTVVILNKSSSTTSLTLTINGFTPTSSEVYRSNELENWAYQGTYDPSITLYGYSIVTIHLTGNSSPVFTYCDAVQAAGYGLTSDIDGDCYVDFKDFSAMADYWLSGCGWLNNDCDGADLKPRDGAVDYYDLDTFVQQWLWCNDPQDPGCEHNW